MAELQTYCEGCGRNFSARYDYDRQWLTLECAPCDYSYLTIAARDFLALPETQQRALHKLAERTAEAKGEPLPILSPEGKWLYWIESAGITAPTVHPLAVLPVALDAKDVETLYAQPLDMTALMEGMASFNTWMEDLVRAYVQAFAGIWKIPPSEPSASLKPSDLVPRTPSAGKIFEFRPITTAFPPLGVGPAAGLPPQQALCQPMGPKRSMSIAEMEAAIEVLRRIQQKEG